MADNNTLTWALWYLEKMNFSVIPIKPGDKKPLVPWLPYQKERASRDQVVQWWTENPTANLGIVTGEISDLAVIDVDNDTGKKNIESFLPDSFLAPIVNTPRGGLHYYCRYEKGMTNKAGVIEGTDFRGEGGYVVAPPSVNGNGKAYRWETDFKVGTTPIPLLPDAYKKHIMVLSKGGIIRGGRKKRDFPKHNKTNKTNNSYKKAQGIMIFFMF